MAEYGTESEGIRLWWLLAYVGLALVAGLLAVSFVAGGVGALMA